jgi:Cytochrome c554 and c-prime
MNDHAVPVRTGWVSRLTKLSLAALLFEAVSGLVVTLSPFHAFVQWNVLAHTLVGVATLLPLGWYFAAHWADYRRTAVSDVVLLGYLAAVALVVCAASGVVVTAQALFGIRTSPAWRQVHLISTLVALAAGLPHLVLVQFRARAKEAAPPAARVLLRTAGAALAGFAAVGVLTALYAGPRYVDEFPEDYSYVYGPDRPFAPSLARTSTGGAFDPRTLAGSESCGSSGCHTQIVEEWKPSAHRYAAMDVLFQGVQKVMAEQNGPESTRYCGGCHDPISLFSGSKDLFAKDLTGQRGRKEGVSCLSCHSIRETDLQGNANYVISRPPDYLWQWSDGGLARLARDFLIRSYPAGHNRLSKRMFKAPEYCAACHKQFVDQEVNKVGWVQNQYDNWKASRWYHEGDPERTIECRECHMPLVDSVDPAAGDAADYNRSLGDGRHRSHRFIAANSMMPRLLQLPGWQEQVRLTERWLAGTYEIPEIRDKWAEGPVVTLGLEVPEAAQPGEAVPVRVILGANKVGHDFPTGPLDIIQSWVELRVTDGAGDEIFSSGRRDEKNFIEPGTFLFKAEPVDQYGNLIDRHNLWEMVGVRYRRALFPGYSDSVEYLVSCPASLGATGSARPVGSTDGVEQVDVPREGARTLHVTAILRYRKVDQFLVNFLLGEDSGVTAPVVEMTRATATIEVRRSAGSRPVSNSPASGG